MKPHSIPESLMTQMRITPHQLATQASLQEQDCSLLMLWHLYSNGSVEAGRELAVQCDVWHSTEISHAIQIWLIKHYDADLGITHTILSSLHSKLVTDRAWPLHLLSLLRDYIIRCLSHPELSVRGECLSLLSEAVSLNLLDQVVHKAAGPIVSDLLEKNVRTFADDDELQDLEEVVSYLSSEKVGEIPNLNIESLQRIQYEIFNCGRTQEFNWLAFHKLVGLVSETILLVDAGLKVGLTHCPLQTLRVHSTEASTSLIRALIQFEESVISVARDPDFTIQDVPDYGIKLEWAPAASMPLHLNFLERDAIFPFEALEQLTTAERESDLDRVLSDISPRVAESLAKVVRRLRSHSESIELILTDSLDPNWQRFVRLNEHTFTRISNTSLMRKARAAGGNLAVRIFKDQVPQANSVRQVFQAVNAMIEKGQVEVSDIADISSSRQVNYYKQGARVLGLFDEDNQPTSRAWAISGGSEHRRLATTAIYFEDSPVGRAWRSWSKVNHLFQVDALTAENFLREVTVGLNRVTLQRRASTLRTWYSELVPYLYKD